MVIKCRRLRYAEHLATMYCIFVFVLMGWSLLPNALRNFQIYCAPPNLGIRTWICRLNLGLGTPSLKSLSENLCSGLLRPEKIHRFQSSLNPRTLDLEASTLPRDHRGRLTTMQGSTKGFKMLMDKVAGKRYLGRSKLRWEFSIRMDLK